MRKVSFIIAAALALIGLPEREAAAAAYCAYSGGAPSGGYENCGFYTWEQCLANISGMGGHCMRNPHDPALWGYPAAHRPAAAERGRRYP